MVSFAKDGLLKNLDAYAAAYGWDTWPVPQLNQNRVAPDGSRGTVRSMPWASTTA